VLSRTSAMRLVGRLILVAAAISAFWLNVHRAEDEGVFENAPIWVLDAVPAALTNMLVASAPRYTISDAVAEGYFVSPRQPPTAVAAVNSAIAKISRQDFGDAKPGYALLGNDDKGIVDFVELSFRVFGLRIESVATAYYAFLLVSAILFCWRYLENSMAMVALTTVLFAEFQVLPYLVFNPQLTSPLALRCLPILSMVACLHCALQFWRARVSLADIVAVSIQVLLVVFVLHMRSTAIWQVVFILGAGVVAALLLWCDRQHSGVVITASPRFAAVIVPAFLMIVGLIGLNAYRAFAFPAEYGEGKQITTRVTWHNIYSGFALDPQLAKEHSLRIDDQSEYVDVGRALKERGDIDLWRRIGGDRPDFSGIKWASYDPVARDVMFEMCRKEAGRCLETFLIYKPYYFFDTLMWFYGLKDYPLVTDAFVSNYFGDVVKSQVQQATESLKQRGLTAAPWGAGFVWMLSAMVVGVLMTQSGGRAFGSWSVLTSLAMMALASLIPSMLGYPAPHGMADAVVAINAALQSATILAVILLFRSVAGSSAERIVRAVSKALDVPNDIHQLEA
jgi:hypothetical protein